MKALKVAMGIATIALVAALFTPIAFVNRGEYRAQIRGLYERLQPGMPRAQVREAVASHNYPNLQLQAGDSGTWYVQTPREFGAGNWELLIEFQGERVSAVRVRTADTHEYPPPEAPPDKP